MTIFFAFQYLFSIVNDGIETFDELFSSFYVFYTLKRAR